LSNPKPTAIKPKDSRYERGTTGGQVKSEILCGVVDRASSRTVERCRFVDAASFGRFMRDEAAFMLSASAGELYAEAELIAAVRTEPGTREAVQQHADTRSEVFRAGMQHLSQRHELREGLSVDAAAELVICFFDGLLLRAFGTLPRPEIYLETVNLLLASLLRPEVVRNLRMEDAA